MSSSHYRHFSSFFSISLLVLIYSVLFVLQFGRLKLGKEQSTSIRYLWFVSVFLLNRSMLEQEFEYQIWMTPGIFTKKIILQLWNLKWFLSLLKTKCWSTLKLSSLFFKSCKAQFKKSISSSFWAPTAPKSWSKYITGIFV